MQYAVYMLLASGMLGAGPASRRAGSTRWPDGSVPLPEALRLPTSSHPVRITAALSVQIAAAYTWCAHAQERREHSSQQWVRRQGAPEMQAPVAQQLYSSTRSMPFQEEAAARGGAAFDSSFGCALDLDSLHWSRARGMDSTEVCFLRRVPLVVQSSDMEMCWSDRCSACSSAAVRPVGP